MYAIRTTSGRRSSLKSKRHVVTASMIGIVLFIMAMERGLNNQTTPNYTNELHSSGQHGLRENVQDEVDVKLRRFLRQHAVDDVIVVSSVGYGYIGLAINLYMTSYRKFRITNHVFVASDDKSCEVLTGYGANCVQYVFEKSSEDASLFYSHQFKRKAFLKTRIVIESLKAGLDTLLVDLDIVFFTNPLPLVQNSCRSCDVIIQSDGEEDNLNVGFYYARPTNASLWLLETSYNHMNMTLPQNSSQNIINQVLTEMRNLGAIKQYTLDIVRYPNGESFFGIGHRMFKGTNPCPVCVIVHNNYILSVEGKQYRFKEYGLWQVDTDAYYSNPDRKYIIYENPRDFSETVTVMRELRALRTAFVIGHILNRTVILPSFHCYKCKQYEANKTEMCHFGALYHMTTFDAVFGNKYRENVFLENDLVPTKVKRSISPPYLVETASSQRSESDPKDVVKLKPHDTKSGITEQELRHWFTGNASSYSVLRFHSLYIDVHLSNELMEFHDTLLDALVLSDFKQIRQKKLTQEFLSE